MGETPLRSVRAHFCLRIFLSATIKQPLVLGMASNLGSIPNRQLYAVLLLKSPGSEAKGDINSTPNHTSYCPRQRLASFARVHTHILPQSSEHWWITRSCPRRCIWWDGSIEGTVKRILPPVLRDELGLNVACEHALNHMGGCNICKTPRGYFSFILGTSTGHRKLSEHV